MYPSITMRRNSVYQFQSTKPFLFERFLSPEKRNTVRRTIGICETLSQKQGIHSAVAMEAAGFHYTNKDDTVRCDECQLEVSHWTLEMEPFSIHKQRSPKCPLVLSILPDEIVSHPSTIRFTPSDADETSRRHYQPNLFVETDKMIRVRARTFIHWPHQASPSSAQMIAAGFSYCNVSDRVICLYCNIICQQWMPNKDDPYEVHKTLSPRCPYIVAMLEHHQATSSLSIKEIVDHAARHSTDSKIPRRSSIKHVNGFPHHAYAKQLCLKELHQKIEKSRRIQPKYDTFHNKKQLAHLIKDRLDLSVSKNLVAEGFDLSIIESCYENQFRLTGDDFIDDCDLRMACIILRKQIELIDGKEENIIILMTDTDADPTTTMLNFLYATAIEGAA